MGFFSGIVKSVIGGAVGSLLGGKGGGGKEVYITGGTINEISKVKDVSIAAFPCPKVNDAGLTGAWWWVDKIALLVAVWATAETYKAAKEDHKIGKRYYNLAKEQWEHFYNYYRPLEQQELDEIWAEQPYKPDYAGAIKGHTSVAELAMAKVDKHQLALMGKYCICTNLSFPSKNDISQASILGDSENFARRYAEKLAQEKNDTRWARRVAAASRGRGLLSASTSFASKASGFYNDYAQAMGGLAGSAMQFSGYLNNRMQTEYNPVRQRIDSRADVPNTYRGFDASGYWGYDTGSLYNGPTELSSLSTQYKTQTGFDPTGISQLNISG